MQYLCSRKFYAKMISLSKAFEERKKARICAMWNSKTTVEGLIPIKREVKKSGDESHEGDLDTSNSKKFSMY